MLLAVDTVARLEFMRKGLTPDHVAVLIVVCIVVCFCVCCVCCCSYGGGVFSRYIQVQFPLELLASFITTRSVSRASAASQNQNQNNTDDKADKAHTAVRKEAIWLRGYSVTLLVAFAVPFVLHAFPDVEVSSLSVHNAIEPQTATTTAATTVADNNANSNVVPLLASISAVLLVSSLANKSMYISQGLCACMCLIRCLIVCL